MKRSFLFSIIFLCFVSAFAEPVTKEQAAEKAAAFLRAKGTGNQNTISLAYQSKPATVGTAAPAKNAYYYVFNNDNKGFVIVGGDDCADEVLGYSDTGTFEVDNIPDNMRDMLDYYAAEIEWARSNKISLSDRAKVKAAAASNTKHAVAPLLTTSWSQHEPYNLKCYTSGGSLAAAGCTAIAMAQVMYYHKWPQNSTTEIPGYSVSGWGSKGALEPTTFSWDLMKDNYSSYDVSDTESRNEIAKFVSYCGRSIETAYGVGTSYAYLERITYALCNYFGYKNVAKNKERKYFTTQEWTDMLLNELENGRPVIYAGTKYANYTHAFVIDGFDGNDMFHINWGWGYLANGYFKLSALNVYWATDSYTNYPGTFSMEQIAVMGISPKQIEDTKTGIYVMDMSLIDSNSNRLNTDTCEVTSQYGLKGVVIRYQHRKFGPNPSYDYALGLFKNGVLIDSTVVKNWTLSTLTWGISKYNLKGFGKNLVDGNYVIKGIDREDANHSWQVSDQSDLMYVSVNVKNGVAILKTIPQVSDELLQVTKIELKHDIKNDNNQRHVVATIKNVGNSLVTLPIYLYLDGSKKTLEGTNIGAGETVSLDFYFKAPAGTYPLKLSYGGKYFYENSDFVITDNETLPELELVSAVMKNRGEDDIVYGSEIECELVFKNSSSMNYNFNMDVEFKVDEITSKPNYKSKQYVEVPAGATVAVPFKKQMAVGDRFMVIISDPQKMFVKSGYLVIKPGVAMWDGSGNRTVEPLAATVSVPASATAVSFEEIDDITQTTIKPNNNPNTLYYFKSGVTVPTSLSKKNVVKGSKAETIALVGGYDFYMPRSFTATKISYSFTPTLAYDGNGGWQTIMLPYTVTSVTSGGAKVDWCRKSDSDKQFLLKDFTGDTASEVLFANVDNWTPCSPYILGVPEKLINKKMVFSASNAWVSSTQMPFTEGANFRFVASTEEKTVTNALVLNGSGTGFVKTSSANVKAGEAYFQALSKAASAVKSLSIAGSTVAIVGDANGDNEITVSDAINLVGAIQSGNMDQMEHMDVNNDGRITVTDVMCIINMVISQNKQE